MANLFHVKRFTGWNILVSSFAGTLGGQGHFWLGATAIVIGSIISAIIQKGQAHG